MQSRLFIGVFFLLTLAAACQRQPPTQIIIVVTATPSNPTTNNGDSQVSGTTTPVATDNLTPTAPPTPDPFPTPTRLQIQIAEQLFEHGRMFWLQPTKEIWVLKITDETGGTWEVYEDLFEEGDVEFDPDIIPPENMYQPERGFGKLWRDNPEIRQALGWGITPEFGYVSSYEYYPGGTIENGEYVAGPGHHIWFSLYGEAFRFNEIDKTWELN
ncbi:MAG: hypothetical protein D6737_01600 [Chloroflexi bacterium]|nr:MAG: hypothetical protein CUN54_04935 [Phototrophicales bacterium]RMF82492.1 MAG: hypothetical protein D6737_01600 [Chloroflexota bacterium]